MSVFARFSGIQQGGGTGLNQRGRQVVEAVTAGYDIHGHADKDAGHTEAINDEFADRFAVIGTPDRCVQRLGELLDLGLDHLVIASHSRDADPVLAAEANESFGRDVIPEPAG